MTTASSVIWHDLECGGYEQDLALWLGLAAAHAASPNATVLDVGAGSGRVSLALARAGHNVVALDLDAELLAALAQRADGLPIEAVQGDARMFQLPGRRFELCVMPMQTLQLLGGRDAHVAFMQTAAEHLADGGRLAVAIAATDDFEEFQWHEGDTTPLPDMVEHDDHVYFSQPTAVRREGTCFVLERRRIAVDPHGQQLTEEDSIALDIVSAADVEWAGQRAGLRLQEILRVPPTGEHIGSEVIVLGR